MTWTKLTKSSELWDVSDDDRGWGLAQWGMSDWGGETVDSWTTINKPSDSWTKL